MNTVKISLPDSWLSDVVIDREIHNSLGANTVWGRIAANMKNRNGRGSLVIDLNENELAEIIEDCRFYSEGFYESSIEAPYKYVLKKVLAKQTELTNH